MRSSNFPFAAIYIIALAVTARTILGRSFAWIPLAFAPLIWYYVSEARPYLSVIALATIVVGAAIGFAYGRTDDVRKRSVWWLLAGLALSLSTSILTIFIFPGLLAFFALIWGERKVSSLREIRVPMLVFVPIILALLAFYTTTLTGSGLRAEIGANRRPAAPIAYTAQVVYEYLGFDGLGPPRNALRTNGRSGLTAYLPWLGLGALLLCTILLISFRSGIDRRFLQLLLAWLVAIAFATALTSILHTRFFGRHLAPTYPLLAFALVSLIRRRVAAICLATVFFVSDVRLTAIAPYWKDDYRSAVRDVLSRNAAQPGAIDWVADLRTASYYGLNLRFPNDPAAEHYFVTGEHPVGWGTSGVDASLDSARALVRTQKESEKPIYVVVSKPDVFGNKGAWQTLLRERHATSVARYRAFEIYVL